MEIDAGIAERGYWLNEGRGEHAHDTRLVPQLATFFANQSVIDIGCGLGLYVRDLRAAGIRCSGFDGNPMTSELTGGTCSTIDFSYPADLGLFDWVLSLEVGEHIPAKYEAIFVDNLHRHNRKGIVLSWAIPNQGGHGHFNTRSNEYVTRLLKDMGYMADVAQAQKFRKAAKLFWFKNTIMVFRKEPTSSHN